MNEVFQSVDQLFERQVQLTPNAIAVKCGEQKVTYAELNRAANQLAQKIRAHGIKEGFAAIYMDRSIRTIVSILGALKAGLAYVPIDLAYPKDRVEFILKDASPAVLLTEEAVRSQIDFSGKAISLDGDSAELEKQPGINPSRINGPNNVAYVIFTSGSTGKPKGVLVTHKNLARLFSATEHWFHFNEKDIWTVFHSFAFDFSVWEMWGALVYGGTAVVVPYLVSRSPHAFYELVANEKVTVLNQTPSAFRQFIKAEEETPFKAELALRYVIFGGEALELQSLKPWFARHGDHRPQLVNMYGITETTVHVTYRPIAVEDVEQGLGSVIGEPIPDLEIALLDENQQAVSAGESGEIYVGGGGVAAGYLNRPELTRQRFVPDPGKKNSGKIFYRSGDLARRLPNGDLEYLGRLDQQVKIRGFRIELGEIEAALNSHPGIRESIVIAQEGAEKRLVAYVVCREKRVPVEQVREHLGSKLPQYMIPAAMVFLDALPLTINGKVDRKALPDPARSRPELQTPFAAPESEQEKALAAIWREVLQLDEIGAHDNFFAIGGDSIRSIQILAKAQLAGWNLTLEDIFQKPTIHELAQVRRETVGQEISAHRLPFELVPGGERAKLPPDLEDAYPAARLQSGMMFHSDFQKGSAVFHDVFSFRLRLPFNEAVLREAVARLVQRHAIYRTGFDLHNFKQPMQLVHKKAETPISVEDLRGSSQKIQREKLVDWVETEKRRRFDWQKPPLMRLHVQRFSDEAFQFIVSFHHVIMDGWSLAAMLAELFQDYGKLLEGKPVQIPSPKVSYRDFIVLENAAANSPEVIHFWKKQVEGAVFGKVPRWPSGTFKGGLEQVRGPEVYFPKELFEKIRQLANTLGVPVRTPLLAAHCKVMGFLTGQTDITTGLVSNGRPQSADGERLIGLFLNTLPFRMQVDEGSWNEVIGKVFNLEREILPHRRMPMADIQQFTGREALFETAFDFVQFHVYRDLPGYKEQSFLEDHYFEANSFTLFTTFMVDASGDALQMHFDYNPNELCEEQVKLICDYYLNTLREMVENPERSSAKTVPLTEQEWRDELETWNNTADTQLAPDPVEELHRYAEEEPRKEAVVCGDQRMSYEELSSAVRTVSSELRSMGAGPETLIGIHCDRGIEMLIAVLGVLDAGAAYVPLDPAFPFERLKYMVEDSGLSLVLTQTELAGNAIDFDAKPLLIGEIIANAGCQKIIEHASDSALAYVLYTSGSTGKPKGVQVERGALRNFLASMRSSPGMTERDRLLAITTLSFDIAALELLLPLSTGATVVLADSNQTKDPAALIDIIENKAINIMQGTPGIWRALLENGWVPSVGFKALCGGEAMPASLARDLSEHLIELWNMYGPTETTVWSAVHKVADDEEIVPIGHPIRNTQIYVLNHQLNPVPIGVEGEIYIAGAGVARGYLNRKELTKARFIANPFGPGERMFKTGDRGRRLPDGTLVCLGRLDEQVKIRGYRIELGEIEAVFGQHPAIASCAVSMRAGADGNSRLVAYYVTRGRVSVQGIREELEKHLPEYMIPSAFVELAELPKTANGKIDRLHLPDPAETEQQVRPAQESPRTRLERIIADVWKELLKLDQIGVRENFFELGGHSLLAMQVAARVRKKTGLRLDIGAVFENPTVERFAAHISDRLLEENAALEEELLSVAREQQAFGEGTHQRAGRIIETAAVVELQNN
jgi:amino acid adenylation domain-containing protein